MTFRKTADGEVHEIDRWDGGVGWMAHPEEGMQRASHALATDAGVWVVDPVDGDGLDALLADLGDVRGVVQLLDRHRRDCATVADRHDVAVHLPDALAGLAREYAVPTTVLDGRIPETDYRTLTLVDSTIPPVEPLRWREACLYEATTGTLVVAESLGTTPYMTVGDERLGVHPMRRLTPPQSLRDLAVERVLVGHGAGIHDGASDALDTALVGATRRAPSLYLQTLRNVL